jgi:biofilm PGA synthesis N-glycosyltransferase PgaC
MNAATNIRTNKSYVLITAAWNEEEFIEEPLRAIVAQTVRPEQYVVVSDGSTDRTDAIVQEYSARYPFIQLHRIPKRHERSFAAQVDAINVGYEQLRDLKFDFVGNVDADISMNPDYFERLLAEYDSSPRLGLSGGTIFDKKGNTFIERRLNRVHSVMHGVQLFRRECFDLIGGYTRLPHGSPDWHAEVSLRMHGWEVRSIPTLQAFQHRPTGRGGSIVWYSYRQGLADYALGTHPLFELAKVARRIPYGYWGINALAELTGFIHAYWRRDPRAVSDDFVRFLRKEQLGRLLLRGEGTAFSATK